MTTQTLSPAAELSSRELSWRTGVPTAHAGALVPGAAAAVEPFPLRVVRTGRLADLLPSGRAA